LLVSGSQLDFEGDNLVGSLSGCEAATGTPLTGNPGFAELDPIEVQNLITRDGTFIVPLASDSQARGAAVGSVPATDQRGAARPDSGADLGAVQYYESHQLTVEKAGAEGGRVVSDRGGIDCGDVCEDTYPAGELVTLRPQVSPGIAFTGWSGACTGSDVTCEVTMDQAKTVTANFALAGAKANIRVRKISGPIAVGPNRTFALARVTCLKGTCSVEKVNRAKVRVRGKTYSAKAIFTKKSFKAGKTRTLKVEIPKRAYDGLRKRKSGIVSIFSLSVANDSGDTRKRAVVRSLKVGLEKK
jgi:uncharacterized repeat protein (TIGR02543 family)